METTTVMNGKTHTVTLQDVFILPRILSNVISICRTRRNGFKTIVDNDECDQQRGILKIIDKRTGAVKLVGPETKDELYEALLYVNKAQNIICFLIPRCETGTMAQATGSHERKRHRKINSSCNRYGFGEGLASSPTQL